VLAGTEKGFHRYKKGGCRYRKGVNKYRKGVAGTEIKFIKKII
jgi:hypothetical protein